MIETGKHQEIYYIGAGLALAGIRDRSAAARVVSLAVIARVYRVSTVQCLLMFTKRYLSGEMIFKMFIFVTLHKQ